jgi:hypothetical protein
MGDVEVLQLGPLYHREEGIVETSRNSSFVVEEMT